MAGRRGSDFQNGSEPIGKHPLDLNSRGIALIGTVSLIGVLTLLGIVAFDNFNKQTFSARDAAQYRATAQLLSQRIRALVTSDRAWEFTISHDPDMACLNSPPCADLTWKPFKIYDDADELFFDPEASPGSSNYGFTSRGESCADDCDFRFQLEWQPVAPTPPSTKWSARVRSTLVARTERGRSVATDNVRYSFDQIRGRMANYVGAPCTTFLGGEFSQDTQVCQLFNIDLQCPTGMFLKYDTATDTTTCKTNVDALDNSKKWPCDSGMSGILPSGGYDCLSL